MLKVLIHGIKDGLHDIELTADAADIPDMSMEYFGEVKVTGKLRKLGNRFTFSGIAFCNADLTCDLTLKPFTEPVSADVTISFIADTMLLHGYGDTEAAAVETLIIGEDEKYFDLSEEVREQLAVMLPMKRIAPEARDKDFSELYPEYSADSVVISDINNQAADERWYILKELKIN